jgi:GTPase SAR1 family protein
MEDDYTEWLDAYPIKICVVGATDLKTTMKRRFSGQGASQKQIDALGVDITVKRIEIDNLQINLIIFDISWQENFGKSRSNYYRGASAGLIAFDKSERNTFKSVKGWLKEFRKYILDPNITIGLVGIITKSQEVTTEEAQILAKELGMSYYETTVSDKSSIEEIFFDLTKKALESKE